MRSGVLIVWAVFTLLTIVGCGGGSIVLGAPPAIKPQPLLNAIEKSISDDTATRGLLLGVDNAKPYGFDWIGFWDDLSTRKFRYELHKRQSQLLYEIVARHCESYSSYVNFLLSVDGDMSLVVEEPPKCAWPLSPEVAARVLDWVSSRSNALPIKTLSNSLSFLQREIGAGCSSIRWETALEKRIPAIEIIGNKALENDDPIVYFKTIMQLRDKVDQSIWPKSFLHKLLQNDQFIAKWFEHWKADGLKLLDELVYESRGKAFTANIEEAHRLLQILSKLLFQNAAQSTGEDIALSLSLIRSVTVDHPLSSRLSAIDDILKSVENIIVQTSEEKREDKVLTWKPYFNIHNLAPYFSWISFRFGEGVALQKNISEGEDKTFFSDGIDQIMYWVTRLYSTRDRGEVKYYVKKICQHMQKEHVIPAGIDDMKQVPGTEIWAKPADGKWLKKAFESKLPPGCYLLEEGQSKVALVTDADISSSFASVIIGRNSELSVKSKNISLGPVFLYTDKAHPKPREFHPPPESNASAFPLLLGMTLPKDTTYFTKGTHFFIYHYVYKKAAAGTTAPQGLKGFPGPNFEIHSVNKFLIFPLLVLVDSVRCVNLEDQGAARIIPRLIPQRK